MYGNVLERHSRSMQFLFLENSLNRACKQGLKFFAKWDAFNDHRTSLLISFTTLIKMEWTKASLIGLALSNRTHFSFIFSKKFEVVFCVAFLALKWKEFLWSPHSYNKGSNLAFFNITWSPSNSLLTMKFPKNHFMSSYHSNMPKIAMAKKLATTKLLGLRTLLQFIKKIPTQIFS